jgi:hypothetical protein
MEYRLGECQCEELAWHCEVQMVQCYTRYRLNKWTPTQDTSARWWPLQIQSRDADDDPPTDNVWRGTADLDLGPWAYSSFHRVDKKSIPEEGHCSPPSEKHMAALWILGHMVLYTHPWRYISTHIS